MGAEKNGCFPVFGERAESGAFLGWVGVVKRSGGWHHAKESGENKGGEMVRMRMLAGGLMLLCAGSFAGVAGQKPKATVQDREKERLSFGVNVVRAINKAEGEYLKKRGGYVNWETLVGNGDFGDSGTKWGMEYSTTVEHSLYGRGPEIVPGWKLRLNVAGSGKGYDLLLEDATDAKCGFAVVSDERGLVRAGRAVECGY